MTWRERVVLAEKIGFGWKDEIDAYTSWQTCAVGEQHALYPEIVIYQPAEVRHGEGPTDAVLSRLGSMFGDLVHEGYASEAGMVLDQIEARVLELKRV